MNKQKAIQTLKNVADAAAKAGLFQNIESAAETLSALSYLSQLEDLKQISGETNNAPQAS